MCRVLVIPKINEDTAENVEKFAKKMVSEMSMRNNDDGCGYAAITEDGKIFGERWLNNKDAFDRTKTKTLNSGLEDISPMLDKYIPGEIYSSFGELGSWKDMKALTLHTRLATTDVGIENTHPFVHNAEGRDISLIHNGMIRNYHQYELEVSTSDSEAALIEYQYSELRSEPDNIKFFAEALEGYYALGILSTEEDGSPYVDIIRGNHANLHAAFIKELNTFVFTTNAGDLKNACRDLKFELSDIFEVIDGTFIRINPISGEVVDMIEFKPNVVNATASTTTTRGKSNLGNGSQSQSGTGSQTSMSTTSTSGGGTGATRPNIMSDYKAKKLKEDYDKATGELIELSEREVEEKVMEDTVFSEWSEFTGTY